jgi:hypothetical protein
MIKLNKIILIPLLIILTSCFTNPEVRNQRKMAGVWNIEKIISTTYVGSQLNNTLTYEGDKLGEITLLNLDINDYNDCYLVIDSATHTQFESNFTKISNSSQTLRYSMGQWGTNPSSLKYINFYDVNGDAISALSWSVSIEDAKLKSQKWVYTHFNTLGEVTQIEEIFLSKQ